MTDEPTEASLGNPILNSSRSRSMARTTRSKVDAYIDRSTKWPEVMTRLRPILAGCGLTEEIKWGKPCFSQDGHNIVIFQEMKEFLALMFFKGALLSDPDGILEEQGPNSRSALRICFRSIDDANRLADTVKAYVEEAIDVEEAGLQVAPAPVLPPPEELQNRLETDPAFKAAFEALTPGRQREYNLYFSDAKQSKTRNARVDKYAPKILAGKGFRDR
ncbi:YdeI/OmpD-associated family protein [Candidatus Microthrix sp.]|uniref:YdeI/OmpD-associated family protein n=2 Tax=Candidatus Neomicrothrix sp. TaxID=2719034 RepID=UPI0025C2D869|nr:YdeI/OmpD-associated family protein [Candidatus Microthrix sp.]